ncbi:TRAP transporter TatT component family protein [Puniceicoccaceae bacterium K14]|nr:TRAP transporter TatT component family protein [Puniceicoccaceae bacterium K14]
MDFLKRSLLCAISVSALLLSNGCSVKKMAMNQIGDALSGGGTVFSGDEDPELVRDALPFSLKLMESVLEGTPEHVGLLTSLTSGFTQYGYGFLQLEADEIEDEDYDKAVAIRERSLKFYLRAYAYGLRGLEASYRGFGEQFEEDREKALDRLKKKDVELLYWTGLSLGAAVSISLDNPELVSKLALVESIMEKCLELDPEFDSGSIHSFFITYEMSRLNGVGDPIERATYHFEEANRLSGGHMVSIYVAYAESVLVEQQDKEAFIELLEKALSVDVDARPDWRLTNELYKRRAKWLLTRLDWLFL